MATKAGLGEHRVYKITVPDSDTAKLTAGNHYIGIDAVAWYVNKENNFFSSRMSTGTLEIQLAGGLEKYDIALGTFDLAGGNHIAPIFNKAVLPDRNYRGGDILLKVQLSALRKDKVLASLLKSAGNATLGIAEGMVSTATLAGPSVLLGAAGKAIISGIQTILTDSGENKEPLFDFRGMEYGIRPEEIMGKQVYFLFHRGAQLDEANLKIGMTGNLLLPIHNNAVLDDGVWILFRIRRSDEYSGVRDWFEEAKKLRMRISNTVEDFFMNIITEEKAFSEFSLGAEGRKTILDEFLDLRTIISNDGVITEREALFYIGNLRARLESARNAVTSHDKSLYMKAVNNINNAISNGSTESEEIQHAYSAESLNIVQLRKNTIAKETVTKRVADFSPARIFESMRFMENRVKEFEVEQ